MHQPLLREVPERELEMLAGPSDQFFKVERKDARVLRLEAAACVEHFENGQSGQLLGFEIVLRAHAFVDQAPSLLTMLLVQDVVLCAPFRIVERLVRFANQSKTAGIAG